MTTDINQFLSASGATSAKFDTIGRQYKGVILSAEVRDVTKFNSTEVERWDDGTPKKQAVITIQTEEQEGPEDDGVRRIFAKGQMLTELRKATKGNLEIGGKLAVKYDRDGEAKKGFNPPKLYRVWYEAPTRSVDIGGNDDGDDESPF